ncbi:hypothetical protein ACSX1A_10430 [Pontibacter sp. MBLB2868]
MALKNVLIVVHHNDLHPLTLPICHHLNRMGTKHGAPGQWIV